MPEAVDERWTEGEDAFAREHPLRDLADEPRSLAELVDGVDVLHPRDEARRVMIPQVLADAGQRVRHLYPQVLEERGRTDA